MLSLYNKIFIHLPRRFPAWLLTAITVGAILWLTLMPDPMPDMDMPEIPGLDKVVHACMFGGLTLVLGFDCAWQHRKLGRKPLLPWRQLLLICLAVILFGGLIELIQGWMGIGRSAELLDFIADISGILLATLALTR